MTLARRHPTGNRRPDLGALYRTMARIRGFENLSADLWRDGLISGELHLGIGEEAVAAGVVGHLGDGDAVLADHRSTPPLLARGVDATTLIAELVGSDDGLCRGNGGHMHLFDPARLAASDGIVGASAPLACGFALAARHRRTEHVAVAFFGEGAANQGMLLESLNLARVWRLPVVFICKDSGLAITTRRRDGSAGNLVRRARGFGLRAEKVSGVDVRRVWRKAHRAIGRARRGKGPTFLLCRVHRPDGHFLGDPLLRAVFDPVGQTRELAPTMLQALRNPEGAGMTRRVAALSTVSTAILVAARERFLARFLDPLRRVRRSLPSDVAARIDEEVSAEVAEVRCAVLDRSTSHA